MMGGNLISGHAHSRDLDYVSRLMHHYNTPAKVRETLELGEYHGITAIISAMCWKTTPMFSSNGRPAAKSSGLP